MTIGVQIDIKATYTNMRLLAKTGTFIRALAPVFTDGSTLVSTDVCTNASQDLPAENATSNMLQAQASSVEALRSACRKSRSAIAHFRATK